VVAALVRSDALAAAWTRRGRRAPVIRKKLEKKFVRG
jgi:hypothetical protein